VSAMAKQVLIVTNRLDLHADLVSPLLAARGHRPFRIDLDAFPRDYQICQRFGGGAMRNEIVHLPTGERLDMAEVGAIWARKTAQFSFLSDTLSPQEQAYARMETEHALFGLLYTLDCYWMSHPVALRGALWKGEQLLRAMRLGFRVPASIVTNSPEQVRAFQRSVAGDLVFKSMSSPSLCAEAVAEDERICHSMPTTLVTGEMMDSLDAVAELACHFQEYIPKQYELRVTVIGEQLFAAKIYSQDDARTAVDSRDMSAEIRYEATVLPAAVTQRCRDFIASYGLQFGALDLIVTPDGEYVFLENNPGGQFLYIEQLIPEFKMLAAVADTLTKEAACRSQTPSPY
jgi:glutathione synthase/RimK-type ligase-like ATP-grasp enzyme